MDDVWDLKFEHIDWTDISDAELSGNQEALEQLMNKSMEIKQQVAAANNSMNAAPPPPVTPVSSTPLTHSTPNDQQPPQSTPKDELCFSFQDAVHFSNPHPLSSGRQQQEEDMSTSKLNLPSSPSLTPNTSRGTSCVFRKPSSYAQIARGSGKRKFADRVGVSPIDLPKKRHAIRELVVSPVPPNDPLQGTPLTEIDLDMETCTPEGDRPTRTGVQRRLFGGRVLSESSNNPPWHTKENEEILTNMHQLAQRQKQIQFGKNTIGYELYVQSIPKWKRRHSDPWTPDKYKICSTRSWQGQIRQWRKTLHQWDPPVATDSDQQFTAKDAALCDICLDLGENPLDN